MAIMKKYFVLLPFLLCIVSCSEVRNRKVADDFELYQQWKDSISVTDINLSFRNAHISGVYGAGSKNMVFEDTAHIRYSKDGKIYEDNNLHYAVSTYNGIIFDICLKTDQKECLSFILDSYLRRMNCPNDIVKNFDIKNIDSKEQYDLGGIKFKNGSLSLSKVYNHHIFGTDERFAGDYIYIISITDSVLLRSFESYVSKQKKLEEIRLKKKDEKTNSTLDSQF